MPSVCPDHQAQMDFFDVSSVHAEADRESIDRNDAPNAKETSAQPSEQVAPETCKPQLSLGLPSQPLNEFAWSEQECCAFLDGMLVDQLRLLADERTTAELRADLISWIAAPMRNLEELKLAPFSFQACCTATGVDFEEMRERTLAMFAPELIDQLD